MQKWCVSTLLGRADNTALQQVKHLSQLVGSSAHDWHARFAAGHPTARELTTPTRLPILGKPLPADNSRFRRESFPLSLPMVRDKVKGKDE